MKQKIYHVFCILIRFTWKKFWVFFIYLFKLIFSFNRISRQILMEYQWYIVVICLNFLIFFSKRETIRLFVCISPCIQENAILIFYANITFCEIKSIFHQKQMFYLWKQLQLKEFFNEENACKSNDKKGELSTLPSYVKFFT